MGNNQYKVNYPYDNDNKVPNLVQLAGSELKVYDELFYHKLWYQLYTQKRPMILIDEKDKPTESINLVDPDGLISMTELINLIGSIEISTDRQIYCSGGFNINIFVQLFLKIMPEQNLMNDENKLKLLGIEKKFKQTYDKNLADMYNKYMDPDKKEIDNDELYKYIKIELKRYYFFVYERVEFIFEPGLFINHENCPFYTTFGTSDGLYGITTIYKQKQIFYEELYKISKYANHYMLKENYDKFKQIRYRISSTFFFIHIEYLYNIIKLENIDDTYNLYALRYVFHDNDPRPITNDDNKIRCLHFSDKNLERLCQHDHFTCYVLIDNNGRINDNKIITNCDITNQFVSFVIDDLSGYFKEPAVNMNEFVKCLPYIDDIIDDSLIINQFKTKQVY